LHTAGEQSSVCSAQSAGKHKLWLLWELQPRAVQEGAAHPAAVREVAVGEEWSSGFFFSGAVRDHAICLIAKRPLCCNNKRIIYSNPGKAHSSLQTFFAA